MLLWKSLSALYISFSLISLLAPLNASAAAPICESGSFCRYSGTIERCYIRKDGLMLLYFDEPVDIAAATSANHNVVYPSAAAFKFTDNEKFSDYLYSSCLTALTTQKKVQIYTKGIVDGYLKADRIWLKK